MKLKQPTYRLGYVLTDELSIQQQPKVYVDIPRRDMNSALHNALDTTISQHHLKYQTNRLGNTVFNYDYTPTQFEQ